MNVCVFSAVVIPFTSSIKFFCVLLIPCLDGFNYLSSIFMSWRFYGMNSIDAEDFCMKLHSKNDLVLSFCTLMY